jgi:hypothetical protein
VLADPAIFDFNLMLGNRQSAVFDLEYLSFLKTPWFNRD